MCWSFWASLAFATIGFYAAWYMRQKKWDWRLWVPLAYFALMEGLQAGTSMHINACDLPINQYLTFLGFLHISFQPFFINMFSMHFIPKRVADRISGYVYTVCGLGAVIMLTKLYPFSWAGLCTSDMMCGTSLCAASGTWHLAWYIPLNGMENLLILGYAIPAFLLPFLYGSWRISTYHVLIGPLLARLLTNNMNEMPAVWCLISVGYILLVFWPKLRKQFHVKKWPLWG